MRHELQHSMVTPALLLLELRGYCLATTYLCLFISELDLNCALLAKRLRIHAFWNVTAFRWVSRSQRFEGS